MDMATLDVDGVVSLLIPARLSSINHFLSHTSFSLSLSSLLSLGPLSLHCFASLSVSQSAIGLVVVTLSASQSPGINQPAVTSSAMQRSPIAFPHQLLRYTEDPTPHTPRQTHATLRYTTLHYIHYTNSIPLYPRP